MLHLHQGFPLKSKEGHRPVPDTTNCRNDRHGSMATSWNICYNTYNVLYIIPLFNFYSCNYLSILWPRCFIQSLSVKYASSLSYVRECTDYFSISSFKNLNHYSIIREHGKLHKQYHFINIQANITPPYSAFKVTRERFFKRQMGFKLRPFDSGKHYYEFFKIQWQCPLGNTIAGKLAKIQNDQKLPPISRGIEFLRDLAVRRLIV